MFPVFPVIPDWNLFYSVYFLCCWFQLVASFHLSFISLQLSICCEVLLNSEFLSFFTFVVFTSVTLTILSFFSLSLFVRFPSDCQPHPVSTYLCLVNLSLLVYLSACFPLLVLFVRRAPCVASFPAFHRGFPSVP